MITPDIQFDFTGNSGVYRFDTTYNLPYDQAKRISDHYPVYAESYTNHDID
jgi:deoxyribonuclease-1-like protein